MLFFFFFLADRSPQLKEMELDQLQNLVALRQLYGLLQNIGNGLPNKSSQNVGLVNYFDLYLLFLSSYHYHPFFFLVCKYYEQLGENARLLLKELLDNATAKVHLFFLFFSFSFFLSSSSSFLFFYFYFFIFIFIYIIQNPM
jgi:hypothetical protein